MLRIVNIFALTVEYADSKMKKDTVKEGAEFEQMV